MTMKTYAVTGATGHVGKVVADHLKAQGCAVRRVSRADGISFDDVAALTQALNGVEGVFLMIPPDFQAPDLRRRQNELGAHLADAVKAARVKRVVFLSSVNAQFETGTGPILGLHDMEVRLNALDIPELVHLRPAYFMENHLWGAGIIGKAGIYGTAFRPDVALPMIATRDIGILATEILSKKSLDEPRVRELLGPRDYTMTEATRILGLAIGKPDLKYVQFPYEEARKAMLDIGMSESYVDASLEIARHFNEAKVRGAEKRSPQNTTPTTLEEFAKGDFRHTYEKAPMKRS